ncbi:hypothetical protein ABZP36_007447 [Zizania latifolia]
MRRPSDTSRAADPPWRRARLQRRGLCAWLLLAGHLQPERTYVWVANRDHPITTPSSAMLAINNRSNLVLSDSKGHALWTATATKSTITGGDGAYAVLLDSGNLVLRLPNGTIIWQSIDHPTDTVLPNIKFLVSYKAQVVGRIVAWKGPDDPSTGEFSVSGDPNSNFQVIIWQGTKKYRRIIMLDSVWVTGGAYGSNTTYIMVETDVITKDEFYIMFTTSDGSPYARATLDYMGIIWIWHWNIESSSWTAFPQSQDSTGDCARYASCGPFGYCDFTSVTPMCQCLDGFEPDGSSSSRGCQRKQELICGDGNHFVNLPGMKVPDNFLHIRNRSFDECATECSRNCSCTAYT